MFDLFKNWITLFFRGKLFASPTQFYRGLAIGMATTAALFLVLAMFIALWLAAAIAGLIGGALQPYLFRDLRYS